jgi:hypothetical protein
VQPLLEAVAGKAPDFLRPGTMQRSGRQYLRARQKLAHGEPTGHRDANPDSSRGPLEPGSVPTVAVQVAVRRSLEVWFGLYRRCMPLLYENPSTAAPLPHKDSGDGASAQVQRSSRSHGDCRRLRVATSDSHDHPGRQRLHTGEAQPSSHPQELPLESWRRPQLSIRTASLRFEMDHLPKHPRLPQWTARLLLGAGITTKLMVDLHLVR